MASRTALNFELTLIRAVCCILMANFTLQVQITHRGRSGGNNVLFDPPHVGPDAPLTCAAAMSVRKVRRCREARIRSEIDPSLRLASR
jgi:hypothetical protein